MDDGVFYFFLVGNGGCLDVGIVGVWEGDFVDLGSI